MVAESCFCVLGRKWLCRSVSGDVLGMVLEFSRNSKVNIAVGQRN